MSIKDMYEQKGFTCDECRWKVERNDCPWNFQYQGTNYAEDCIDFRYIKNEAEAFTNNEAIENDQ